MSGWRVHGIPCDVLIFVLCKSLQAVYGRIRTPIRDNESLMRRTMKNLPGNLKTANGNVGMTGARTAEKELTGLRDC